jgi:hypothetical protein
LWYVGKNGEIGEFHHEYMCSMLLHILLQAYFVFYKKASSCNVKYSTKDFRTRQNKNISAHKIYDIGSDDFFIYFTLRHDGFL